jgi:HlyD family secretion protein
MKIVTGEKSNALIIPRSTLFRGTAGRWQLYSVRDGYARLQEVRIGMMNDEEAEIVQGIAEGDLVVFSPESTLADGQRVRIE